MVKIKADKTGYEVTGFGHTFHCLTHQHALSVRRDLLEAHAPPVAEELVPPVEEWDYEKAEQLG